MNDLLDDAALDQPGLDERLLYEFNDIGLALRLEAARALAEA